jgi:hypothetical protein
MFSPQHLSPDNTARTEFIRRAAIAAFALVGLFLLTEPLLRHARSSPKVVVTSVANARPTEPRLKTKPIETIQPGEKVWACDPTTGAWSAREVLQHFEHDYNGDMVALTVAGERIEATGNHPFWVVSGDGLDSRPAAQHVPAAEQQLAWMSGKGRWVDARHLQPGDVLLIRNGQMATVEQKHARQAEQKVYNLQVADVHTYAVTDAGVVVHNRMPPEPGMGWGTPKPGVVFRNGGKNPGALTPRPGEPGISCRDVAANPFPKPETGPVFRIGDDIQIIDTSLLPPGSVIVDGAPYGPMPPGHVTIVAPPGAIKGGIIGTIKPGQPLPPNIPSN